MSTSPARELPARHVNRLLVLPPAPHVITPHVITPHVITPQVITPLVMAPLTVTLLAMLLPFRDSLAAAKDAAAESAAVPVVTAVAAHEDIAAARTGIGTVQPAQSVTVRARVDGQLEKVSFAEGQDVKQGQLLAQIDARPYQALLDQALAQKARDEASLSAAQKDLERYSTLVAQGSIQRQALDAQQSTVGQLRAALLSDQAQIDNARVQLGYTSIRAPINGRTGLRLVDAGNLLHATDTTGLVVINQIDPIAVLFTLPEDDFQAVNEAMRRSGSKPLAATALARNDSTTLGQGRLLLLNNRIDTTTGTFQLKAEFSNADHRLWPGQYVMVRIDIGSQRDALTVPSAAIQRGPAGLYVYVVQPDSTVVLRAVKASPADGPRTVVDSGLNLGERVVVDGQLRIKPGAKVVVTGAPAAPASAGGSQAGGTAR